jgi:hypothetical protein
MRKMSYQAFAKSVSCYLASEWPAASLAIASSQDADRAAARACLACFVACASVPHAAGDVAAAVREMTNAE